MLVINDNVGCWTKAPVGNPAERCRAWTESHRNARTPRPFPGISLGTTIIVNTMKLEYYYDCILDYRNN